MKKVAAYCRVSTDSSDQANSLLSQEKYFREYIGRNPEWELAQVFVDIGITGTSTKKRNAFNQMINEAMTGNFSLILTKEISRFARNTLDSIYYTRKLKEYGVGVIFMNDNINTLDPDAELRLTIMSSIAQEESRKTSERVKWGQKRRMEQGVVFGRDMLGYDVRNGTLSINEEGAKIVRLIFHKFVNEEKGTHVIARELQETGVCTSAYMRQWSNTVILRVIRNEKYIGDLIQKKTITPSYLNHEKKYNKGEEELVVLRNHHEPIISRELFDRAQQELARRSPSQEQRVKHSNRYCFSGKIKCGICGSSFVSRTKKRKDGSVYRSWRCYRAVTHGAGNEQEGEGGCHCPSVNEEDLKCIMQKIAASLLIEKCSFIQTVGNTVEKILQMGEQSVRDTDETERTEALIKKKQGLIELYLTKDISKMEFQQMRETYESDISALKKEQSRYDVKSDLRQNHLLMIDNMRGFISDLIVGKHWNDIFYRNLLDIITVSEDNTLTVSLNRLSNPWCFVVQHGTDM